MTQLLPWYGFNIHTSHLMTFSYYSAMPRSVYLEWLPSFRPCRYFRAWYVSRRRLRHCREYLCKKGWTRSNRNLIVEPSKKILMMDSRLIMHPAMKDYFLTHAPLPDDFFKR